MRKFLALTNRVLISHLHKQKGKLSNKDFTIICNNCIGGVLLKDLKQRFNTPTIDLYFNAGDFVRFLQRLDYYLSEKITISFHSNNLQTTTNYPVGNIKDIEIHFLHYDSIHEAEERWNIRKERIN